MGVSVRPWNFEGWPGRVLEYIGLSRGEGHPLLKQIEEIKQGKDYSSWARKIDDAVRQYHAREQCETDTQMMFKVYDGVMSEEAKEKRCKPYEEIADLQDILYEQGYRLVKYTAIEPSEKQKKKIEQEGLFYEYNYSRDEFETLYRYVGQYQNNFPNYFADEGNYEKYLKTHDIWVLEKREADDFAIDESNTTLSGMAQAEEVYSPVGFASWCISDNEDDREVYKAKEGQTLLYHDTVALDAELQGRSLGKLFVDIQDAYYLNTLGKDIQIGICTGDINMNDKGQLSKGFHEKRGFGDWVVSEYPLKKWIDRYLEMGDRRPQNPAQKNIVKMYGNLR